ncbi:hypothetical protein RVR_5823 [Actinacidiphila reveromycinica]|uniref:Uncharacterized protein n=1 Tax=Actinacidiphila reveromycinica TaxID=659352 RepID=A0A7U3UVB4_9ACTN|nr:hypothetical protein [Streptomyces sp. SN-593]BBA99276.1 hypothetical protein RVR_5823 [Streptomyces sp. SN-593]
MGLREIKDAVDRAHPDWPNKQKIPLIKELRDQERIEVRAGRPFSVEQVLAGRTGQPAAETSRPDSAGAAAEPDTTEQGSVGGSVLLLILLVAVPRLIGLGVWGSIYDEPGWWNVMSAVLTVLGIFGVVSAVKGRSTGG